LGYNTLLRSTKGVMAKLNNFAHDLHAYFITGSRINTGSGEQISSEKTAA
jgi:biopolymer transport protein ExbB